MLVDYGSDSDDAGSPPPAPTPAPAPKKKAPKKIIAIEPSKKDLPDPEEERPAKRARIDNGKGAGTSSLFSMLPAPKVANPVKAPKQEERVLGGGGKPGLVFNTARSAPSVVAPAPVEAADEDDEAEESGTSVVEKKAEKPAAASGLFMPTNVRRGKANVSLDEFTVRQAPKPASTAKPAPSAAPAVDFFGLDASTSSAATSRLPSLPKVSSAPKVEEYVPPEPQPTDPYPGYYQLPSGEWAAYETAYYSAFLKRWQAEYDAHVRDLEKNPMKGFEGYDESAAEVNAAAEMERAREEIKEREDRKALTMGDVTGAEPKKPNMNIGGAKLGKGARTRHQLTTLLADAYSNREALEAKIAEGKRNRKEAGNKYGF
ncbi:unnamed protein product [Peniophora sp. CBMAI 1063]|nr:unnamed protein product [Peniophora sp. CBMAI 1063]